MKTIKLCKGKGKLGTSHCVMAATSIVAGEPFSDRPHCVCPTITAALVVVNDACPTDEIRERLLGHLPWLIIGTRGSLDAVVRRAQMFAEAMAAKTAVRTEAGAAAEARAAARTAARTAAVEAMAVEAAEAMAAWEKSMKHFIDFIESEIIPVYTTMPIEPSYDFENLIVKQG